MGGPNKVNEGGGVQAGADFEDGGAPPLKKRLTARQKGGGVSTRRRKAISGSTKSNSTATACTRGSTVAR